MQTYIIADRLEKLTGQPMSELADLETPPPYDAHSNLPMAIPMEQIDSKSNLPLATPMGQAYGDQTNSKNLLNFSNNSKSVID
jgi:hypothetical protein